MAHDRMGSFGESRLLAGDASVPAVVSGPELADELRALHELRQTGRLDEAEYAAAKQAVLGEQGGARLSAAGTPEAWGGTPDAMSGDHAALSEESARLYNTALMGGDPAGGPSDPAVLRHHLNMAETEITENRSDLLLMHRKLAAAEAAAAGLHSPGTRAASLAYAPRESPRLLGGSPERGSRPDLRATGHTPARGTLTPWQRQHSAGYDVDPPVPQPPAPHTSASGKEYLFSPRDPRERQAEPITPVGASASKRPALTPPPSTRAELAPPTPPPPHGSFDGEAALRRQVTQQARLLAVMKRSYRETGRPPRDGELSDDLQEVLSRALTLVGEEPEAASPPRGGARPSDPAQSTSGMTGGGASKVLSPAATPSFSHRFTSPPMAPLSADSPIRQPLSAHSALTDATDPAVATPLTHALRPPGSAMKHPLSTHSVLTENADPAVATPFTDAPHQPSASGSALKSMHSEATAPPGLAPGMQVYSTDFVDGLQADLRELHRKVVSLEKEVDEDRSHEREMAHLAGHVTRLEAELANANARLADQAAELQARREAATPAAASARRGAHATHSTPECRTNSPGRSPARRKGSPSREQAPFEWTRDSPPRRTDRVKFEPPYTEYVEPPGASRARVSAADISPRRLAGLLDDVVRYNLLRRKLAVGGQARAHRALAQQRFTTWYKWILFREIARLQQQNWDLQAAAQRGGAHIDSDPALSPPSWCGGAAASPEGGDKSSYDELRRSLMRSERRRAELEGAVAVLEERLDLSRGDEADDAAPPPAAPLPRKGCRDDTAWL